PSTNICVDCDNVYLQDSTRSVGSIIKTKAVNIRADYHSLTTDNKAIVSLGLNSIVDLNFTYLNSQPTLFTSQQWKELRKLYQPKYYNVDEYNQILPILRPVFAAYNEKKSFKPTG
ncbi:hypothetical protein BDF21DRAFT_482123, partial [Thamnidium elegans]